MWWTEKHNFTYVPVSVNVCGVEYPILTPVMSIIDSHKSSKTWATGKNAKYVSLAPALKGGPQISRVLAIEVKVEYRFLWVNTTPLGTPVDPEVYIIIAASSLKKE